MKQVKEIALEVVKLFLSFVFAVSVVYGIARGFGILAGHIRL